MKSHYIRLICTILLMGIIASCSGNTFSAVTETPLPTSTATAISPTETPTITPSPIPPTPTAIRTPPDLPAGFQTNLLSSGDSPHTYVADTCQYLKNRWDPNNSLPGTVVMIIMIHGVSKTDTADQADNGISHATMKKITAHAAELGFQTVTTEELANFLESNAKIPRRSIMFLVDDRHSREYYDEHFVPFLNKYDWHTVTNAWISYEDSIGATTAPQMQELVAEGVLDVQAHGYVHNINITSASTDDFITQEIGKSQEIITTLFGKAPIAYIWPGGSFTARGVQIAREFGYRLGFTINPRGPVMYNWIPLAEDKDPMRPSYLPEGQINDPLMVLPRYWSTDALNKLDGVTAIGDDATTYAMAVKETELLYYDIVCREQYGPIPEAIITQ